MTPQPNDFTIEEAAEYCNKSIHTIKCWIRHKDNPLPVRRKPYRIYIDKEVLDTYLKALPPKGRPSILPSYKTLAYLRTSYTAQEISLMYDVTENAVWAALNRGKKDTKNEIR